MFAPANQPNFGLSIEGVQHDLQVLAFTGHEAIGEPYRFDIELVSERANLDLEGLLHKPAFLSLSPHGAGIHGQIQQVSQGDSNKRLTHYRVNLVPRLAYLALRINQRIFQHLTAPQIIARVLEEHGILADAYCFRLGPRAYPELEYCTQYGETDLGFVQRIASEHGLHLHFEHRRDGHLLIFGDDQTAFARLDQPIAYVPDSGMLADAQVVKRFSVRIAARTSRVTRRDYNFEKPRLLLEATSRPLQEEPQPDLEDYDYPGRFTDREHGTLVSQHALQRHRADYRLAEGHSDQPALRSGHFLMLTEHPREEWNDLWLLTGIHHKGKQPQVLEEFIDSDRQRDEADFHQGYRNHFTAIPWDVFYRPPLDHPRPRVLGSQSAVVTGPPGEEIHCDRHGRVRVQFFWDREGRNDDHSSCWVRVASGWAGNGHGAISVPRVGMEVLVSYFEGDPDQPLVTGCLYNAESRPPYLLPEHKTRSVFKSLSSPGGGGANELRIEDRKGQEQIYLHAQRDLECQVRNDDRLQVGGQRSESIRGNSVHVLEGEEQRSVSLARKTWLGADDHLSVAGSVHTRAGQLISVGAGQEVHLSAGAHVVLDAGASLTLSAAGQHIMLGPGGIFSSTPIQLGGAPVAGTPAMPLPPGTLEPLAAPPMPPAPPAISLGQAIPMNAARQWGSDYCPLCEACREGFCETGAPA